MQNLESQGRFSGVFAATTTPFSPDGRRVDADRYAEHCAWLVDSGVQGIVPNGSLGEYETLTEAERREVFATAQAAVGTRVPVVPGVSGKGAAEAVRWTEEAAEAGAPAVMCLPPTSHAPTPDEAVAHFAAVAAVGLPVIVYNNPFSTRIDLTPPLLARIAEIENIAAVKEFSQDVRRIARIRELAPSLEVLVGCDDLLAEGVLMGATGWIAGFVNALPASSVSLFDLCAQGKWSEALPLYRALLPVLRYDAEPTFVQAIKLGQDEAGRYGGPARLPRLPLPEDDQAVVRTRVREAIEAAER
ncbi:dihydrodipicolinate synthase family protein [Rugosimonospora africana]|uniref:Dihydrodipicolinate synthase family protein n=1 Tax=Rugosimonospora africana TaxID=556532 RepID=A0A8J3VS57_9ACTN|nr:dihydrodipicolinate synthase family protein [Rugosimonospora africana]GIH16211.1 dihydrodipicolinate synthase family protein [Rugosimonospora africana]